MNPPTLSQTRIWIGGPTLIPKRDHGIHMAANVAGHVVMDMLRNEGQLFQKTHLAEKEELQKCLGQRVR